MSRTILLAFCSIWLLTAVTPAGEHFAVESSFFVDGRKKAEHRNTTMFKGGLVYDFGEDGAEITLLDRTGGRMVLLDPQRQVRTALTTDQIVKLNDQLRHWAARSENSLLTFAANPTFTISEEAQGTISVSAPLLSYEVTGGDADADVVSRYRHFSDWYARLNSILHPSSLPPFPRLEVNRQLEQRGMIPQRVRLTLTAQPGVPAREIRLSTRHKLRHGLTGADLRQIEQADRYLVTLREVSLKAYRQTESTAAP